MSKFNYEYLIGNDKEQVKSTLGLEFNYFHSDVWSYYLKTDLLGIKHFLVVIFFQEVVQKVTIKKTYAKSPH